MNNKETLKRVSELDGIIKSVTLHYYFFLAPPLLFNDWLIKINEVALNGGKRAVIKVAVELIV